LLAQELKRPWGVTIVGALTVLGGIFLIGLGLAVATVPTFLANYADLTEEDMSDVFLVSIMVAIILVIFLPLGIGLLVIGFGALKGKKWAWPALLIACILSIAAAITMAAFGDRSSFGGMIVNSFIVAYLFTNQAKTYFGRIKPAVTPQPSSTGTDTPI
jgi:hypothetical protein